MENGHPTEKELSEFAWFQLSLDHAEAIKEHLRTCLECNAQYRERHQRRPGARQRQPMHLRKKCA